MDVHPWLKAYPPGVCAHIDYPDISLPEVLEKAAANFPQNVAMSFFDHETTYAAFNALVSRFAQALISLGVQKGDRVAVMGPNCPQWEIAFFGALRAGAIVVQTNPMYLERELTFLFNDAEAETVVVYEPLYQHVAGVREKTPVKRVVVFNFTPPSTKPEEGLFLFDQLIAAHPEAKEPGMKADDVALLQYTGGTTGRPKGVMLTHKNLVANAMQTVSLLSSVKPQMGSEVMLTVLPLFHVYGMTVAMNVALVLAAKQVILPRFNTDEVLAAVSRHNVTLLPGAPTMYVAINNYAGVESMDLSSIKGCISGSAPLPPEVQRRFEELTGGVLVEGYGLTESSPVTHCNPLAGKRKIGTIGVPLPDTVARIVDVETGTRDLPVHELGELVVTGPQIMKGYWRNPGETAGVLRDGWLFTGDLGTMDEEGFFTIVDRKKDIIIAGGFNIYPREVEDVLFEHPKVKEAVVVGIPDEYRGETVKAYIVLRDGVEAGGEEIIQFVRQRLASYKVPHIIEFRDQLPKSAVGKALRRVLREEKI